MLTILFTASLVVTMFSGVSYWFFAQLSEPSRGPDAVNILMILTFFATILSGTTCVGTLGYALINFLTK